MLITYQRFVYTPHYNAIEMIHKIVVTVGRFCSVLVNIKGFYFGGTIVMPHSDQLSPERGHRSGRQVTLILYSDTAHKWRLYARLCMWNVIDALIS